METTLYELWFGKKPKLLFLKVWGYDAYVDRLRSEKIKPKAEKCIFIEYPNKTIGYTFYLRSEGKVFVAKNGSFLEKEFLSKELSGRKIEIDEVVEPLLQPVSSATQKDVSVTPTSVEEESNDSDHEASDQVAIEPRRSTTICTTPEWYGNPVLDIMLLDNNELWRSDGGPVFRQMVRSHEIRDRIHVSEQSMDFGELAR